MDAEPPRDTSIEIPIQRYPEYISVERGIFIGHRQVPTGDLETKTSLSTKVYMSRGKSIPSVQKDWADAIKGFMEKDLRTSRQVLASRLNISEQTISNWLNGRDGKEPTAEMYYRMARLCPQGEYAPFLIRKAREKAPHLKAFDDLFPPHVEQVKRGPTRSIPLTADIAAYEPRTGNAPEVLTLSSYLLGASNSVVAFRLNDAGMRPLIEPGYIVVIDMSVKDPDLLRGMLVVAVTSEGVTTVRRVARAAANYFLTPNILDADHQPLPLSELRIVGKVILWIATI